MQMGKEIAGLFFIFVHRNIYIQMYKCYNSQTIVIFVSSIQHKDSQRCQHEERDPEVRSVLQLPE